MRLIAQGKDPLEGQRHMCGMGNMFNYHSTGFPELDELMRTPQSLIFIMELLQVGDPLSYQRESWMMEKDEKLQTVPILHMQGNLLVKQTKYREAASKYKEAVLLLKTVQSREMPGDIDYINLGRMIIPLELNFCQCMLELEEYYEVIEHTTELLEKHKDCVKGYYKRAKAHAAVWNEKEARRDFHMVVNLDVTLASLINRELRALSETMKEKYWEEKEKYWNMLEKKEKNEDEGEEEEDEEEGEDERQETSESLAAESPVEVGGDKGESETPSIIFAEPHKEDPGGNKVTPTEGRDNEAEERSSVMNPSGGAEKEEKDWQQMLRLVMFLQKEGNFLIKENQFQEASVKFKEAIEYVDVLRNMVDPRGEDRDSLEKVCLPLTLNLSQCMLELKEYQQVVELNGKLLKKHKGNFKAVYQRAKAHAALCNKDEARRDFETVEKLDPTFKPFVRQELKKLGERVRIMQVHQNKTYRDTTQEKWGPGGSKSKSAAGKKQAKCSQKASEENTKVGKKTENSEMDDGEEKPTPAETEGVGWDGKAEHGNKEPESGRAGGERLDKGNVHSVEVHEDERGEPDNQAGDGDSDPATTSTGKDNVESTESAQDKVGQEGQMPVRPKHKPREQRPL
nr:DNA ligase 1 isoform X2 [Gasterosteus aculeatus aculeatus]